MAEPVVRSDRRRRVTTVMGGRTRSGLVQEEAMDQEEKSLEASLGHDPMNRRGRHTRRNVEETQTFRHRNPTTRGWRTWRVQREEEEGDDGDSSTTHPDPEWTDQMI